jgi:Glycosyl hydrolase catalytic core
MKKSTPRRTTASRRDAPASSYYSASVIKQSSSPRHDFIDAFYGDIEKSLQEDNSSNTGNASSDGGAVVHEVSSMVIAPGTTAKSKTSNSTLPNDSSAHQSSSEDTMTAATPPPPIHDEEYTTTAASLTASTPLGLKTPPHQKRVKMAKIRAVEPVVQKSRLYQIPSTQILGYRDFSQEQAFRQQQSRYSASANIHPPLHTTNTASHTCMQQKEKDRLDKRKSNRVLFILALIAVICFAMICAVIILVVLNYLARNNDDGPASSSSSSSSSSNGRLFLGPGNGPAPIIMPGSGPTTSAPTPISAEIRDPILASLLDDPASSSSSSSSACPTTTGRISHPPLAGKKGVALTLREEGQSGSWVENMPKLKKLNPYWNYSYEAKRIVQQPADIEFIPMIWGGGDDNGGGSTNPQWLQSTIDQHILPQVHSGEAKRLLAFHEPDLAEAANMSVAEAIQSWKVLETAGLPLISPSAANPVGPVRFIF